MINPNTYTPEWIAAFRRQRQYRSVNAALFEKMIYAFSLLESLAATGFDFIFKGAMQIKKGLKSKPSETLVNSCGPTWA
ncbi:MAG: hypothetical protein IPH45_09005 [Bacteroidales bacterium]|nr:hypothetical protein [Bacteroidales bacterium]